MSTIIRDITEELIHAYVDNQLSPDEHSRFQRIIEKDPKLSERVQAYQNQNSLLHDLFDPVLEEPIPQRLLYFSDKSTSIKKGSNRLIKVAASFVLVAIGASIGWFAKEQDTHALNTLASTIKLARTATVAHLVYVPEIKHPVEVTAEQEQHLVKWLSKRLGKKINVPDLNSYGYGLVGGRLLPAESGPAAQFMYENTQGERLTLYVRRKNDTEGNTAFRFHEENNTNAFYWIDGNLGYVIVGNVNKKQLLNTANEIYQQLSL